MQTTPGMKRNLAQVVEAIKCFVSSLHMCREMVFVEEKPITVEKRMALCKLKASVGFAWHF